MCATQNAESALVAQAIGSAGYEFRFNDLRPRNGSAKNRRSFIERLIALDGDWDTEPGPAYESAEERRASPDNIRVEMTLPSPPTGDNRPNDVRARTWYSCSLAKGDEP